MATTKAPVDTQDDLIALMTSDEDVPVEEPKVKAPRKPRVKKAKAAPAKPAKKASKKAPKRRRKPADEDDDLADEEEVLEDGKSIVKSKYRAIYKPHSNTNGDTLAQEMSAHISVESDKGRVVDVAKLKRFAIANACWVATYAALNPGQQRMNVGNRLRARIRKGHVVVWK